MPRSCPPAASRPEAATSQLGLDQVMVKLRVLDVKHPQEPGEGRWRPASWGEVCRRRTVAPKSRPRQAAGIFGRLAISLGATRECQLCALWAKCSASRRFGSWTGGDKAFNMP